MATVNLGSIKFKWKGTYSGATAYTVDDVVEYNGSSYICILASTGNLPTNATYFEQMSAKGTDGTNGTNGTDVGTVITTQGDLLYRDGSGLQRLGAGTAGQVLQTGGAGANPSWGTVSSDFVKIASGTNDGTTNSIAFDNVFISPYKWFKIAIYNWYSGSSSETRYRWRVSGTTQTNGSYISMMDGAYRQSGTNCATQCDSNWNSGGAVINFWGVDSNSNYGLSGTMDCFDTYQNSKYPKTYSTQTSYGSNSYFISYNSSQFYQETISPDGIEFYLNNGANFNGEFIIYGIK